MGKVAAQISDIMFLSSGCYIFLIGFLDFFYFEFPEHWLRLQTERNVYIGKMRALLL